MDHFIQYVAARDIDRQRWDEVVSKNTSGLIYAQSAYLDAFAGDWAAILIGDYNAVMPLPLRKKWGVAYYFHPPFIQQLGLIGTADRHVYTEIIDLLFARINYGDILLNFDNEELARQLRFRQRTNFVINLASGYEAISAKFHPNVRRNLATANAAGLIYDVSTDVDEAVDFYQNQVENKTKDLTPAHFSQFKALCRYYQMAGKALIRKVTEVNGAVLSIAVLLVDDKRIYNIMSGVSLDGRQVKAHRFLIVEALREFAGRPLLFDFEGSDIPGVKEFYSKFGGDDQPYFSVHHNQLNFFARLFKK